MVGFTFHISERTTRELIADPLLPSGPTVADIQAALARLMAREQAATAEQRAKDEARKRNELIAIRLELEQQNETE